MNIASLIVLVACFTAVSAFIAPSAQNGVRSQNTNLFVTRAVRKPAAKKPAAKKVFPKKTAAKKVVAKKPVAKKVVTKKPVAKKVVVRKPAAKKVVVKKAAPKRVVRAKKLPPKDNTKIAQRIFGMDLWAPISKSNDFGARTGKKLQAAALGRNSYVPEGLSKADYMKVRNNDDQKKKKQYSKVMSKVGSSTSFYSWYKSRGTDKGDKWLDADGRGHAFAKTKYNWGAEDDDISGFLTPKSDQIKSMSKR